MSAAETSSLSQTKVEYPSSDGKRMADNTRQARWIIYLYNNLKALFSGEEVFIAADLLWYPVEGQPRIAAAPDVMVAMGRPDGDRSSYLQWEEADLPPQVVVEVLSPSNTTLEMFEKQQFYARYGVEELIVIEPGKKEGDVERFVPFLLQGDQLKGSDFPTQKWTSPRLGITFQQVEGQVQVFLPDGKPFRSFEEVENMLEEMEAAYGKMETAYEKIETAYEQEKAQSEAERSRAEAAEAELAKLKARLKDLEG
ncbi:MAG: Uma2 family endonuclease [Bacteroidota bacterium]